MLPRAPSAVKRHEFVNVLKKAKAVFKLLPSAYYRTECENLDVSQLSRPPRCESGIALVLVRFEDFTAVNMKNGVFWDVTLCGSCKNRCFRGM
jgi:hypothetical protein